MRYPEQGDRVSKEGLLAFESQGAGLLGTSQLPTPRPGVVIHPPPTPTTPGFWATRGLKTWLEASWALAGEAAKTAMSTQTARDRRSMDRSFSKTRWSSMERQRRVK
jgi:hypothetical protein